VPEDAVADATRDAPIADAGPPGCLEAVTSASAPTDRLEEALGTATVTIEDRAACRRTYLLSSTAARRDDLPASPRTVVEREDAPSIRTGHDLFDALYALAVDEARENSVEAVSDYAFASGTPLDCGGCYETGRLWSYVWTRDTAFSAALGLAPLDPERARRSLEFKLSERRGGGGLEIVQDTGSGGSWPVSTDRVSWALGAAEVLAWLDEPSRSELAALALRALRNTIERDRRTVFDPGTGLYRGETSFLDWREQTYPDWAAGEMSHVAMSRSLSTNVLHYRALEIAADLAERAGSTAEASRWRGWAVALRDAIRARLREPSGLYSAYLTTDLDTSPVRRWDLLGNALAIVYGVASPLERDGILANYPHVGPGAAPVIAPQQQATRIYHNRAEWPFATAFWLRAASGANDEAAYRATVALVRGAALFLSNVENLEITTGATFVDDGAFSGPVVNSQRQLWSIAGYLDMVQRVVFGVEASIDGIAVHPSIAPQVRERFFGNADAIVMRGLRWRSHVLDIVVHFPPERGPVGRYVARRWTVDGSDVGSVIGETDLAARSRIDVHLETEAVASRTITVVDPADWRRLYGPRTPRISGLALESGRVRVAIDLGGEAASDVVVSVHRDGARVAESLPGTTTSYLDDATDSASVTHCWAVETCFVSSGNCSQHSAPSCFWGAGTERVTTIPASSFAATGGEAVTMYGRFHYQAWGDPGDRLEASGFVAARGGRYLLQVLYGNGGPVDTGITCAVKRVLVEDEVTGEVVASGTLVMPHRGAWDRWGDSTFAEVALEAGRRYRFVVTADDDTVNMSSFEHFSAYTAGAGGSGGAFGRVNVAELRVLYLGP
jgi:hypothetical protein